VGTDLPERPRRLADELDVHDRLRALEAVLPGNDDPNRSSVLLRERSYPAEKPSQGLGFVLGNKVVVGTVNANREYF
jgi:hypothetical protein